jgi:hypothetical protein
VQARRKRARQRVFSFCERAQRVERVFKMAIVATTITLAGSLLVCLPAGRYATSWLGAHARRLALRGVGLTPERSEIDEDWRRKRRFDIEQSTDKLAAAFAEYAPPMQKLLRFAGLDPDHVLIRWGNFNRTVLLPATVFEADDSGRSYRFRPNVRSIWVRNFPMKGDVKAYFQVLDTPEVPALLNGTGAAIVAESVQTTNSWGLRGPEPNLRAPWRGIILGDSYMQGLFVGDQQTPTECLKRDLRKRLQASVEILNGGHLGYSPEQYYFTLVEYARRFPPRFVVVSFFANDFGELSEALEGRGDWEEGGYWLNEIHTFCRARDIICLFVPAPWVNQIEGASHRGYYPGMAANTLGAIAAAYVDPMEEFANAQLDALRDARRTGKPVTGSPLFNGRIGDGHFSPQGCELWAATVGRRLALLLDYRHALVSAPDKDRHGHGASHRELEATPSREQPTPR